MRTSIRERIERVESMRAAPMREARMIPSADEARMGVRTISPRQVPRRMETDRDTPMETDLSIWRGSIWAVAEGPVTRTGTDAMASHGMARHTRRRRALMSAAMRAAFMPSSPQKKPRNPRVMPTIAGHRPLARSFPGRTR